MNIDLSGITEMLHIVSLRLKVKQTVQMVPAHCGIIRTFKLTSGRQTVSCSDGF